MIWIFSFLIKVNVLFLINVLFLLIWYLFKRGLEGSFFVIINILGYSYIRVKNIFS